MLLARAGSIVLLLCLVGSAHAQSVREAEWLLRQDPNAFTLQLITVSNQTQLGKIVQTHENPENFARFRVQGRDQLLYVLTYGVFEHADQADAARNEVAEAVGLETAQLWTRRLDSVQRAIRTTLQQ